MRAVPVHANAAVGGFVVGIPRDVRALVDHVDVVAVFCEFSGISCSRETGTDNQNVLHAVLPQLRRR
jgi:hypothetical protein